MKDFLVLLTNALGLNAEAFSVLDSNLGDLDGWDSLGKFFGPCAAAVVEYET